MMQPERQHIERMLVEDLLPYAQRAIDIAFDPVLEGGDVGVLTPGAAGRESPGGLQGVASGGQVGRVEGEHLEVALQDVREAELRIGGEQGAEALGTVGAVLKIAEDGMMRACAASGDLVDSASPCRSVADTSLLREASCQV
jgi:hypothetical protein